MSEVQERRHEQDLQIPPGSTRLLGVKQKSDSGKSLLQGGKFLLQLWEELVMLTEEQRKRFANLFFGKLLQKLANKGNKSETELKQFIEAKNKIMS